MIFSSKRFWQLIGPELIQVTLTALALELLCRLLTPWYGLGFLLALIWTLGRYWLALYRLQIWLQDASQPPVDTGIWGWVASRFQRLQLAERRAQENQKVIIDRARQAIGALERGVILLEGTALAWWNPAAARMLGLREHDRQQNILNLIRHPDFIAYFQQTQPASLDGIQLTSGINPNHILRFELTRYSRDERILVIEDVTRLYRLERMRKDFVANLSHELRTPLTVISGYVETLLDQDGLPPRLHRVYSQMQQQSMRMTHLLDDLLLLSRLEHEDLTSKSELIDMPAMLNRLFDQAQAYNMNHHHALSLDIDADDFLVGAEKELTSAFYNLVTNAIKYTPAGGHIRLHWYIDRDGNGIFSVQDDGNGIAPEHLPRLTERFYRIDPGRSRETGGTGLGLAIVKHVLLQHDAYLTINSIEAPQEGHGTTFSCHFPVSRLVRGNINESKPEQI